ncbi:MULTISPECIES: rhodanese-like domain-containing protein [unclassified Pseudonocardia]|uniref:rhodanese-like domain-containing protein n=1 Tax=unclassified Pseudonocardia TaxID=2619320 RepID=UPI0001FFF218|nr:rhodanese-like domain-containing protein [Pseudonocardia sp. Ae707_Ps1]OLM09181.1 Rhodanese-related sulfurtransferase [Pseudonocardia sp. Ae707_Ps1]
MTESADTVDPVEAERLAYADVVVLLDVRENDEWQAGHALRARHMPLDQLDPRQYRIYPRVITVCRSGRRSPIAAGQLREAGVAARNMAGGMEAWANAGRPVIRDDDTPRTVN